MSLPEIKSGKFHAGSDLRCGKNVVVDVAEECIVGDRCVLPDNAYLSGRRIVIGDDFFGYSWEWRRLDVGRGRRDEEHAVLEVGSRCTFHDNRIDLAESVSVGNDVGLSPEVAVYTHYYWLSPLNGYPMNHAPVQVCNGVIVGFRSVLLPGCIVDERCVVGAQSVVAGMLNKDRVYAGDPARFVREVVPPTVEERRRMLVRIVKQFEQSRAYRGLASAVRIDYPFIWFNGASLDCSAQTLTGEEDDGTDDLRWHLFTRGIRIYTQRPFKKLVKNAFRREQ